jgi:hypothetical protein
VRKQHDQKITMPHLPSRQFARGLSQLCFGHHLLLLLLVVVDLQLLHQLGGIPRLPLHHTKAHTAVVRYGMVVCINVTLHASSSTTTTQRISLSMCHQCVTCCQWWHHLGAQTTFASFTTTVHVTMPDQETLLTEVSYGAHIKSECALQLHDTRAACGDIHLCRHGGQMGHIVL